MEIKVMEDIADNAKANRCVLLRGSAHYDEIYSMFANVLGLHAQLTKKQLTESS